MGKEGKVWGLLERVEGVVVVVVGHMNAPELCA